MCNPASFVVTKNKVYWSKKSDSHLEIIAEFGLNESGLRGVNVVPVEITPPKGNLSLPLSKWVFAIDYQGVMRDLPEWWDGDKYERMARTELKAWKKAKLSGIRLREAFNPVNPLLIKADTSIDKLALLKDWSSVESSVWSSVWSSVLWSVLSSVESSVESSVWWSVLSSVEPSVWSSVRGYIGSLFTGITTWKYTDKKDPWQSIRALWLAGYVPSFDGTTWRLHAGKKAKVVFEITAKELRSK